MATYKPSTNTDPTKATYGTSGADVSALQKSLNDKGANLALDGKYGPLTQAAYAKYGATTTPAPVVPPPVVPAPKTDTKTNPGTKPPRPIYDEAPALITAKSEDEIQQEKLKQAQGEISALNDYYATLTAESKVLGEKNMRSTDSISVLTGLQGSTEAGEAAKKTGTENKRDLDRIANEKNLAIQTLLGKIKTSAVEAAKQQRLDARQSEQDRISFREKAKAEAVENLTALAKSESGATLEGLQATLSPEEYRHLIENSGGESMAKAILFENRAKSTVLGTPQVMGGQMVQAYTKPDGTVKYEKIDLPEGVVPDKIEQIIKDDSGIFIINKDGTFSRVTGSGKTGGGTGGAPGGGGTYSNDLDAIVGTVLSTIPSKFGQQTFNAQISKARNDEDKLNIVAAQVLKGQPAEFKNDFRNQATAISSIDKAIAELDSGTKTGVINSALQYTYNIAGKDFDPKLAKINSYITSAIQPYRSSITGAAWGDQEDAEYAALFGSTKYAPKELKERLVTLKDILKSKSAIGLNSFVNPMGYYDNQFESGAYTPTDSAPESTGDPEYDAYLKSIE